jgi:hypothetical protein
MQPFPVNGTQLNDVLHSSPQLGSKEIFSDVSSPMQDTHDAISAHGS